MDIRKSNIPYRVSGSIPVKKTYKSTSSDTKSTINSTEIKKTITPPHTQVRTTSKVSSVSTEIRRTPNNRVSSVTDSFSKLSTSDSITKTSTPVKTAPRSTQIKSQPVKKIEKTSVNKTPPLRTSAPVDPNLVTCPVCGRHFNQERIGLHQNICKKTTVKKRRPFDPVKHRLQGTEAEDYLKKPKRASASNNSNTKDKKSNWRKKHEEFIAIVRSAREAQAHVARGGKLSDLPPPPAMSTEDLKQCPHCGRKFNEGAAERHIPKCANIRSNKAPGPSKTKPAPGRR